MATDGKARLRQQLRSGTRDKVVYIDDCRLRYGFDRVCSLTPKVETRLRSGEKAAIPLKIQYTCTSNSSFSITLTLFKDFPRSAVEVSISGPDDEKNANISKSVQLTLQTKMNGLVDNRVGDEEEDESVANDRVSVIADFESLLLEAGEIGIGERESGVKDACTLPMTDVEIDTVFDPLQQMAKKVHYDDDEDHSHHSQDEDEDDDDDDDDDDTKQLSIEEGGIGEDAKIESFETYRCTRCRLVLFTSHDTETHENKSGITCTSLFLASAPPSSESGVGASIGTDTGEGINLLVGVRSTDATGCARKGILSCSKCACKLGTWSWVGQQCSCGHWQSPAFQVPNTRVDAQ
jgi:dual specificity phosphatase 12